jgi:putative ABC transport system permease protein
MSWLKRLVNTVRSGQVEREIRRELEFHVAERADELRNTGLSPEEAERRARVKLGNPLLQAERTRDMDIVLWADGLARNLRHAARSLGRAPGFALTVVATLALGIGANTAVFSALDAVLLRPLPFPDADRLVRLSQKQQTSSETMIAPVRLEDWNRLNSTFSAISGYGVEDVSETSGDLPERVRRAFVTPRMLEVWGVAPARGRGFSAEEHRFGGPAAALVSDRYWRSRMGSTPDVLSRSVRIGNASVPIVGVMPASFRFPDRDVDVWFPSPVDAPYAQSRHSTWYTGVGRLRPGVTLEQARADLSAVQARLAQQFPDPDRKVGVELRPLKQDLVGGIGRALWLLFGAVSVLLLIACTNIAALFVARGASRRPEIAVRLSLGASRAAVAGLVLAETLLLALVGGALGLLVAGFATAAFRALGTELPRMDEVVVDGRILLYCSLSTLGVALVSGLAPAVRAMREDAGLASGESGRTQVSGSQRLQWALVGGQVALSVTLLMGAGLLVRSFHALARVEPGFEKSGVLTFRMSGSWNETADYPALVARVDRTIDTLRALPGVEGAATTGWALPGTPTQWETTFAVVEAGGDADRRIVTDLRVVSPEYFATMRIPLLQGEQCERRSVGPRGAPSGQGFDVMVNRAFAARHLSDFPSAVGLHLQAFGEGALEAADKPGRIVGVVGDAREQGIDRVPEPIVYSCLSAPGPTPFFLVRTSGDPLAVVGAVRARMKELEPQRSVYDIAVLDERIDGAYALRRLLTLLLVAFSLSALSLASVGLYGTLSYAVGLRRREVGLRMALGALRADIVRQFLGQGLRVVGLACAGGVGLALALRRVLAGLLYGVSATDGATLLGVVAMVAVVAALASLAPALRAARLDPMRVLRES